MDHLSVTIAAVVGIVVLLLCSAFFSSSETAVFSLSPEWVERQATSGDRRAAALAGLLDDPHRLLVTLLVGNNVVNIALTSIITVVVSSYLPPGPAVGVATLLTSVVILTFGEIVPKAFGLENAARWSLTVAVPIRLVERSLSPLIWLFDGFTRRLNAVIRVDLDIERPYMD